MNALEEVVTIKQCCYSEKAGRTTVYARIKSGAYVAFKIGGSTRITVSSIKAFRQQMEKGPVGIRPTC